MNLDTQDDEHEIVARAKAGDRFAFDELYSRHVKPVYWQAYSVVSNAADAEEVTQDVFVTAWRKMRDIDLVGGSLLPWLLVTAKYTAANKRRASLRHDTRATELQDYHVDRHADVEAQVEAGEVLNQITKSLAALSPADRDLYDLCIQQGKTYAEAADTLGVSHGSVRNRVSRLRQRLRADLHDLRGAS